MSGGQLLEQVIHLFDLILYFLGPIRQVHAFQSNLCHRHHPDYTVEDTSVACLLAESGAMVSLAASNCAIPGRWEAAVHLVCEHMTAFYSSVEPGYIVGTGGPEAFTAGETSPALEPHRAALLEFLEAVRGSGSGSKSESGSKGGRGSGDSSTSVPADAAYRAQELVMRVLEAAG